jgi:HPr kinase/phosphorylase
VRQDEKRFTVLDLLDLDLKEQNALDLRCIGGRKGLPREITTPDLNRPGLALSGFYESFAWQRLQIFGRGENAYLKMLAEAGRTEALAKMFEYPMPCCIFTHNLAPGKEFFAAAEAADCPVLQTDLPSSEFSSRVLRVLSDIFSPQTTIHGVLVEVYGIGILLTGDSGVGKSETALELVERGHRLVADDVVEIRCVNGSILMGQGANKVIGHHMEIRGLGIINVTHLFGVGAIRDKKQIQLVCGLEQDLRPRRHRGDHDRDPRRPGRQARDPREAGTEHPHHHRDRGDERAAQEDGLSLCPGVQPERPPLARERERARPVLQQGRLSLGARGTRNDRDNG